MTTSPTQRSLVLVIPGVPVAQPRPRAVKLGNHAAMADAPATHPVHAWRAAVAHAAHQARDGADLLDEPLRVELIFSFPRPAGKIRKTKPMPKEAHVSRPDVENLAKAVLDALTGVVWRDDSLIWNLSIIKLVAEGLEPAKTTIRIDPVAL